MLSFVRKRLTYSNIAMTIALFFAMSSGAYAAKHYLVSSTGQISPKVLKALRGPAGARGPQGATGATGAQGAQGATGPQGPAGPEGKAGAAGQNGSNGTSVTSVQLKASDAACKKEGGSEFTAAEGAKTTACNGSPWTAGGTLPKGSSETGQWAVFGEATKKNEPVSTAISFPIPLAVSIEEAHVHLIAAGQEGKEFAEECPGTVTTPQAKSGSLCVYTKGLFNLAPGIEVVYGGKPFLDESTGNENSVGTSGTSLRLEALLAEAYFGGGTWAVTG